jgi:hypothetical protein
MSSVPPDFVGPILQSNLNARQVSQVRDADRNQRVNADRQQSIAIDEKGSTVETAEDTMEVFTDSEGAGSQGRAFTQAEEEDDPSSENSRHNADPEAEQGQLIDFEA